ncbi:MAG: flagellar protein FlaG [Treponema sp.]|jgi:flagellar protein FlaG|nr:flagellar protein FlaG [Treponema sp.]
MGIQIAVAGNGFPQQELPQERIPVFTARSQETRAAVLEKIQASLPGNGENRPPDMESAAAEIERVTLAFNKKLKFVVDHQSHEVTVKVIDPRTDKVIKVLPPEELQRLHRRLKETIGVLFDERI